MYDQYDLLVGSVALAISQSAFEGQMLAVFESVWRLFSDYIK